MPRIREWMRSRRPGCGRQSGSRRRPVLRHLLVHAAVRASLRRPRPAAVATHRAAAAGGRTRRSGRRARSSSSCRPVSLMRPSSITRMRVGMHDGRQPVRDHDGGAALAQLGDGVLDVALGFGVERGGRLVEQDDRRVLDQRAGDGDALALAAGQLHAVFADLGVVAVREAGDEVVRVRGLARRRRSRPRSRRAGRRRCSRASCRGTDARSARHRRSAGAASGARPSAMSWPSMMMRPRSTS